MLVAGMFARDRARRGHQQAVTRSSSGRALLLIALTGSPPHATRRRRAVSGIVNRNPTTGVTPAVCQQQNGAVRVGVRCWSGLQLSKPAAQGSSPSPHGLTVQSRVAPAAGSRHPDAHHTTCPLKPPVLVRRSGGRLSRSTTSTSTSAPRANPRLLSSHIAPLQPPQFCGLLGRPRHSLARGPRRTSSPRALCARLLIRVRVRVGGADYTGLVPYHYGGRPADAGENTRRRRPVQRNPLHRAALPLS